MTTVAGGTATPTPAPAALATLQRRWLAVRQSCGWLQRESLAAAQELRDWFLHELRDALGGRQIQSLLQSALRCFTFGFDRSLRFLSQAARVRRACCRQARNRSGSLPTKANRVPIAFAMIS